MRASGACAPSRSNMASSRTHPGLGKNVIRNRAARSLLPVALSRLTVRRSCVKGHFDHSSTASIVRSRTSPPSTHCHHFFGVRFTHGETAALKVLFRAQRALRALRRPAQSARIRRFENPGAGQSLYNPRRRARHPWKGSQKTRSRLKRGIYFSEKVFQFWMACGHFSVGLTACHSRGLRAESRLLRHFLRSGCSSPVHALPALL